MTGTQPHTASEANPHVKGPSESKPQEPSGTERELLPDRPPHPPQSAPPGTGEHRPKRPRGFAAMDRTLVSEIARKGGKAAHSAGTAHEFTSEEARVAGRKGGRATHAKRRKTGGEEETAEAEEMGKSSG
ncbi:MAG: KGG domain-containing protein [Polyangiaceae bacterium]